MRLHGVDKEKNLTLPSPRPNLRTLGTRRVTRSNFHTGDTQILGVPMHSCFVCYSDTRTCFACDSATREKKSLKNWSKLPLVFEKRKQRISKKFLTGMGLQCIYIADTNKPNPDTVRTSRLTKQLVDGQKSRKG